MNISATIILDTRKRSLNGYPIKIRVYESKLRKYKFVSLKLFSESEDWNGTVLKSHPDYRTLNRKLSKREASLVNEVEYCNENKLSLVEAVKAIKEGVIGNKDLEIFLLKQRIGKLQQHSGKGVIEFFKERIQEKTDLNESVKAYKGTMTEIENYISEEDVPLNSITYEWLNEFIIYKKKKGTGESGIMTYLKNFKAVYKEAQRRTSLNVKKDNPFENLIKKPSRITEVVELSVEDFIKLKNFVPYKTATKSNRLKMKRNIDMWLFQFLIGGHDYVDVANLKWKNLKNNRLRFKRFKNRNKPGGGIAVEVLLTEQALNFINIYGDKDSTRIFEYIPNPNDEELYGRYRNNVNRSLRKISEKLELTSKIKTKSPRYLFRSRAGELLLSTHIIELIQGHKSQGVSFSYQGTIPFEIQDKEHLKVISFLN